MEKVRILLVDDYALLSAGKEGLLSKEPDFEVVGNAGNGEEALKKAQELNPDLVLMDINMPETERDNGD